MGDELRGENLVHLNVRFSTETELKKIQDFLYEKSGQGVSFTGLVEAMANEVTIVTAVHNIKSNKGSRTAGVDKIKMDKYLQMPKDELILLIQSSFRNYRPKPARREYIEKSNGKKRPLGIPTVLDRIIQECVRIIIEPICEARFYPQSYGFRPYRAQKHAIRGIINVINAGCKSPDQPVWAIEGDIKGCFDNINHRLLLQKLWRIGIHDKRVLKLISQMLKAGYMENDLFHVTELGTPQGGILSPLLSNVYEGYGAQKLSHYLYEQGVVGRNNKNIPNTSIVRMIKNKGYTGYLINGAVETECPQLRIIEPELFEQAQELRQARTCERGGTSLGTSSKALLTGLVYCGHCGNRLSLTSSGRTHTYADGHTVKEVRPRYSCFYKIRHPGDCDGQSGYGVSKLDSIVEEVVRQIFAQFREVSRKKLLESVKTNDAARIQKKIKKIQKDLESKQKELDDLKAETILVIRGVSALDKELLGTLVAEARETLETLEKQLVQAQEEYEEATKTAKRSNYICNELFTWADVYDTANHDERRAILQQFIAEIRVRKDYEISITLNASFNQVEQLKAVSTYDGAEIFEEISEKRA